MCCALFVYVLWGWADILAGLCVCVCVRLMRANALQVVRIYNLRVTPSAWVCLCASMCVQSAIGGWIVPPVFGYYAITIV